MLFGIFLTVLQSNFHAHNNDLFVKLFILVFIFLGSMYAQNCQSLTILASMKAGVRY